MADTGGEGARGEAEDGRDDETGGPGERLAAASRLRVPLQPGHVQSRHTPAARPVL